jgi:membrane protein implicated in regulation of membrane protease activity
MLQLIYLFLIVHGLIFLRCIWIGIFSFMPELQMVFFSITYVLQLFYSVAFANEMIKNST